LHELTDKRGERIGGGARSYDDEKAWSSINDSKLSGGADAGDLHANFANKTEARDLHWCRCAESSPYQVASVQIRADMQMYEYASRYILF
jgi:hypothetical protein